MYYIRISNCGTYYVCSSVSEENEAKIWCMFIYEIVVHQLRKKGEKLRKYMGKYEISFTLFRGLQRKEI